LRGKPLDDILKKYGEGAKTPKFFFATFPNLFAKYFESMAMMNSWTEEN
jgi:hypothetical protein